MFFLQLVKPPYTITNPASAQGESLYSDAQKEYTAASSQASRGLTDLTSSLVNRTRALSLSQTAPGAPSFSDPTFALPAQEKQEHAEQDTTTHTSAASTPVPEHAARPDSLPADIVKEATSLVSRFRSEAAKRLTEIQRAEDAADEALLKFGSNIRNFLRDAVTVTGPDDDDGDGQGVSAGVGGRGRGGDSKEVLFETNDSEGKRVFHSSRFDAQLHVVHTTPASFTRDAEDSAAWTAFAAEFDVDKQTEAIARDLARYEELRRAMERLVPETVEYAAFWRRYYFLRKVVEEDEARRKEVLRGRFPAVTSCAQSETKLAE